MFTRLRWSIIGLVVFSFHAKGWPIGPRPDAEIADDAKIIVIGRVKPNSLKNLVHRGSFETEAILLITRTLKGKIEGNELPIRIGYDACPIPQHLIKPDFGADGDHDFPYLSPFEYTYSEPIPLYENNADGPTPKVIEDVRHDNIWFLRPYRDINNAEVRPGILGVLDFRDVQPLARENDFKKLVK